VYLLQFSGRFMSIVGASSTLLDAVCTSTVSAATASAYLSGEFHHLSASPAAITVALLVGLTILTLAGLRESAIVSAMIYVFHVRSSPLSYFTRQPSSRLPQCLLSL
jgi:hypothetical protein